MLDTYQLPHLTFEQQAERLQQRGLKIDDMAKATVWLERVGYYRLKPYWTALVDLNGDMLPNASLAHAVDLYCFDARLRNIVGDALERIEVMLRVKVSHAIGRRHVAGHLMPSHLDPAKTIQHADWQDKANAQLSECREQWLQDFLAVYGEPVPTWMAVEAWSFGTVSKLYALMNRNDRAAIAKGFVTNPETFTSWMRTCSTVRNTCAHHNRLWNKPLVDQPVVPKTWEAKPVQHIGSTRLTETRVYSVIALAAYCLRQMGNADRWVEGLKQVVASFPKESGLRIEDAGFPGNWENEPLWVI